jgi:hypothetical protein
MTKRDFPTEVVLSILTGRLLCDFADMHECIEFLAGEPVFTHQLAFKPFVDECADAVRFQCPALDVPEITVFAIGELLLMIEGKRAPEVDNLILGWLSKRIWPACGRTVTIVSMPNMKAAADSFIKPLEGKPVIIIGLPTKEQS